MLISGDSRLAVCGPTRLNATSAVGNERYPVGAGTRRESASHSDQEICA